MICDDMMQTWTLAGIKDERALRRHLVERDAKTVTDIRLVHLSTFLRAAAPL